ncbi:DUF488 domain-containing protein [Myxococcus sp. 1LA]
MTIRCKRAYEAASRADGRRFLVDRLWPRGVRKTELPLEAWLKDAAPSPELRKWFAHDPARWPEFRRRYAAELAANPAVWQPLLDAARQGTVTLVYSAHDTEHNNAAALQQFLEEASASAAPTKQPCASQRGRARAKRHR